MITGFGGPVSAKRLKDDYDVSNHAARWSASPAASGLATERLYAFPSADRYHGDFLFSDDHAPTAPPEKSRPDARESQERRQSHHQRWDLRHHRGARR